jgi:hypothetical protein
MFSDRSRRTRMGSEKLLRDEYELRVRRSSCDMAVRKKARRRRDVLTFGQSDRHRSMP